MDIGGSRVSLAMMTAEAFGIAAEDVHPSIKDTDSIGYNGLTAGSSTTLRNGVAIAQVAKQAIDLMKARAARLWETEIDNVDFADGIFFSKAESELKLTFKELARKLMETGGPISTAASVAPRGAGPSFSTHMVDVEVDPETGKVEVLKYTAAQDVGVAIHPSYVEGQVQGGAAQGIGWALNEEYFYDAEGRMMNSSYLDYRLPTSLDLPEIDAILVQVPNPDHPFGVRGVAEISIVPPAGRAGQRHSRSRGRPNARAAHGPPQDCEGPLGNGNQEQRSRLGAWQQCGFRVRTGPWRAARQPSSSPGPRCGR